MTGELSDLLLWNVKRCFVLQCAISGDVYSISCEVYSISCDVNSISCYVYSISCDVYLCFVVYVQYLVTYIYVLLCLFNILWCMFNILLCIMFNILWFILCNLVNRAMYLRESCVLYLQILWFIFAGAEIMPIRRKALFNYIESGKQIWSCIYVL